jgi:hypothetical protein
MPRMIKSFKFTPTQKLCNFVRRALGLMAESKRSVAN